MPVSATAPVLALSFLVVDTAHAVPSQMPIPTPIDIVVNGPTAVSVIVSVPVSSTVNEWPAVLR